MENNLEKKKSFVLYLDQKEVFDDLDDETAGQLIKAIFEYETTGKINCKGLLKTVFLQFRSTLDRNYIKWMKIKEQRSNAGKIGMQNRWKTKENEITNITNDNKAYQDITKITVSESVSDSVSVNVSVNDNVNNNKKNNKSERENKGNSVAPTPTLPLIISYGKEFGVNDDYCNKFFNYYESIGWLNGNGLEIKNWKLVFNNWVSKDKKNMSKEIKKEKRVL
jgi:hypothetical protein